MQEVKGRTVGVAMSGGVDSSVAALLLAKAGADVFGVTMDIGFETATAESVAKQLGIEWKCVDLRSEFKHSVVNYFVSDSVAGRTPNPCGKCNVKLKFGVLLDFALGHGADLFATGHYVQNMFNSRWVLKRAADKSKDQSYVLGLLSQEVLSKCIFPLGERAKEEVRRIASEANVNVLERETQDLCFLDKDKGGFIGNAKPGLFKDKSNKVLGEHRGAVYFSVGQRKGIGIRSEEPLYVVGVDGNDVVVGSKEDLMCKEFYVANCNWVSVEKLESEMRVGVRIRNSMDPMPGKICMDGGLVKVALDNPVFAVPVGQIASFTDRNLVVGAGWIEQT